MSNYNFTQIGPNAVQADCGFSVRRIDRMELRYEEGGRSLSIEVEPGDGLAVYAQTISCWNTPYGGEVIAAEKKADIIQRIRAALEYQNVEYIMC